MQVFGRSKICKRGNSVNTTCYLFHRIIIDRSRTPGSLQPLGSFLFTGVAVKELTSPTSLRHWICQEHSHYGV